MGETVETDVDEKMALAPFLGKAKELPGREVVFDILRRAPVVEGQDRGNEPCPVCGTKVDTRLVAVEVPGRRRQLLPSKVVHLVTAHDFWHPSMNVLLSKNSNESDAEVVVSKDTLPFSGEEFEDHIDVDQIVSSIRQPRHSKDFLDEMIEDGEERSPGFEKKVDEAYRRRMEHRKAERPTSRPSPSPRRPSTSQEAPSGRGQLPVLHSERPSFGAEDKEVSQISNAYGVPIALAAKTAEVARMVGAHPFDLANLIAFESSWNPAAVGPSGVGATGLIQFTPRTAKGLGTSTEALRKMSAMQQMVFVQKYLERISGGQPISTPHRLYMSVFYPNAMTWHPTQAFPEEVVRKNTYRTKEGTISIQTPLDYAALVERSARLQPSSVSSAEPSIFEMVSSWFSEILGTNKAPSPAASESTAQWMLGPGVEAVLVDRQGREWGPGKIPSGEYELHVRDQTPSVTTLSAGRSYRASSIGRMFEVFENQ